MPKTPPYVKNSQPRSSGSCLATEGTIVSKAQPPRVCTTSVNQPMARDPTTCPTLYTMITYWPASTLHAQVYLDWHRNRCPESGPSDHLQAWLRADCACTQALTVLCLLLTRSDEAAADRMGWPSAPSSMEPPCLQE